MIRPFAGGVVPCAFGAVLWVPRAAVLAGLCRCFVSFVVEVFCCVCCVFCFFGRFSSSLALCLCRVVAVARGACLCVCWWFLPVVACCVGLLFGRGGVACSGFVAVVVRFGVGVSCPCVGAASRRVVVVAAGGLAWCWFGLVCGCLVRCAFPVGAVVGVACGGASVALGALCFGAVCSGGGVVVSRLRRACSLWGASLGRPFFFMRRRHSGKGLSPRVRFFKRYRKSSKRPSDRRIANQSNYRDFWDVAQKPPRRVVIVALMLFPRSGGGYGGRSHANNVMAKVAFAASMRLRPKSSGGLRAGAKFPVWFIAWFSFRRYRLALAF